jgi:hypothetical protein
MAAAAGLFVFPTLAWADRTPLRHFLLAALDFLKFLFARAEDRVFLPFVFLAVEVFLDGFVFLAVEVFLVGFVFLAVEVFFAGFFFLLADAFVFFFFLLVFLVFAVAFFFRDDGLLDFLAFGAGLLLRCAEDVRPDRDPLAEPPLAKAFTARSASRVTATTVAIANRFMAVSPAF